MQTKVSCPRSIFEVTKIHRLGWIEGSVQMDTLCCFEWRQTGSVGLKGDRERLHVIRGENR